MAGPSTEDKVRDWGYLVGGEWRQSGDVLEVRHPYDGRLVARTRWTPAEEVEEAVARTVEAAPRMASMPTHERVRLLEQMAAGVDRRKEELARCLALEAGKPMKSARVEIDRAAFTLRDSAGEAARIGHEFLPLDVLPAFENRWGVVRRFPVGPVFAVTPFNFPVNLVCHKLGPAMAAGCPVLLKPSPRTPITAVLLAEIAAEAGVPEGALNLVNASNELTAQLAADERFRLLTFTGSAAVGWQLKARAGRKRVALELGGNAGTIIHSDADLDYAAARCVAGGFGYAGQSCISVQRILVHKPAYNEFLELAVKRAQALVVGDPMDDKTDVGPMITEEAARRVESWVEEATAEGAKLLTGGKRQGAVFHPAVLTATKAGMKVNCDEVFGPVVTVEPYEEFDQALEIVNDSPYGLQAGVFTRDLGRIFRAYEKLEVGGVMANDISTFRVDTMPYGGIKQSGAGREGARYAIEEMTERRILMLNLNA